jgi:acyl-CoA synthetase (AMP-forming)/AMP-acid ligase II
MILKSPHPDIDIPDNVSLPQYIFGDLGPFANKPAIIDGLSGQSLTYGQLYQGIQSFARGLKQKGFGKGDVFAIYCPNLPEYAIVFFGVAMLGGINTTINPLYTVDELTRQLKDANAKFLLTVPLFLDNAREAALLSDIEEVFVFGEAEGATSFNSLLQTEGEFSGVKINPVEDIVVLPYSSGTTGMPKGVMLTHYNLVANITQLRGLSGVSEQDTLIAILPFFHIFGMVGLFTHGLLNRATNLKIPRF